MIMGLECLSYKEWLRAGGEEAQGDLINVSKYLRLGRVKKMKPDSSQWSPATRQEAMAKFKTWETSSEYEKTPSLLLWGWLNTRTSCQEVLFSLSYCHSVSIWLWPLQWLHTTNTGNFSGNYPEFLGHVLPPSAFDPVNKTDHSSVLNKLSSCTY